MKSARQQAIEAFESTSEEAQRIQKEKERRRELAAQKTAVEFAKKEMIVVARRTISAVLKLSVDNWVVEYADVNVAALRDPQDRDMTLSVTGNAGGALTIHYQPYSAWGWEGNGACPPDRYWRLGPVVLNMTELGKAIRDYEKHVQQVYDSMPLHMP